MNEADDPRPGAPTPPWSARNQRWLAQRFAFWRGRIERDAAAGEGALAAPPTGDPEAAPLALGALFGLSTFERELVVLCAGVDLDLALRGAVARAQGLPPTAAVRVPFSLALAVLPEAHWDALSPLRPLRLWSLLEFDATHGLSQALLRLDERVLHYMTGVPSVEERLTGLVRVERPAVDESLREAASRVARALREGPDPIVTLPDAALDVARRDTGRSLTGMAFGALGLGMLWVDAAAAVSAAGDSARGLVATSRLITREAALLGAGVALAMDPDAPAGVAAGVVRLIAALRGPVVVLGALAPAHVAELPARRVTRVGLPALGARPLGHLSPGLRRAAERALEQFRVEPGLLRDALTSVEDVADEAGAADALWGALREAARGGLDALAQRITSRARLDDLVLPSAIVGQLREIAAQLRHRGTVYERWGFADRSGRGLGIAALFAGDSGTGKTLAAEAIANEAGVDVYRIDLSSVVSKFIGETEKNLARLFDAAERSGAVLLFDEADALFGKRSEVKDSHDRYANLEVAYLLQRVETYRGLAILTTNLKGSLDRAFLRRLRFVVPFPFPDPAARAELWRRSIPDAAPRGAIDWGALARLQLAGGNIRSIALNAAFRAAERGGAIEQADLVASAQAEFSKLERVFHAGDASTRREVA